MNVDSELLYKMDGKTAELAKLLSTEMRTMDELLALRSAMGMSEEDVRQTVSEWWSKRLLMGSPRPLATPSAR